MNCINNTGMKEKGRNPAHIPHPIWGSTKTARFLILGTDPTAPVKEGKRLRNNHMLPLFRYTLIRDEKHCVFK